LLAHSSAAAQLPPFAFLASQAVPLHHAVAAQSLAPVQVVLQLVAPHA
jgi:hypothetical protein